MNPRKIRFFGGFTLFFLIVAYVLPTIDAYDTPDPKGNVTITWDIVKFSNDVSQYNVKVSIINYQLYRHVENPGWKLQWDWWGDEVIWSMQGAEAVEQGNCQRIKSSTPPHCCKKTPRIIDLLPSAPYNMQTQNCCKGGVISTINQDPTKYGSFFQMSVTATDFNSSSILTNSSAIETTVPQNFSLGIQGYTCSPPLRVPSSKFSEDHGRRTTEAFLTWNVTCTYSQFQASKAPTCCVSLSAFYNDTITMCPKCSCACRSQSKCISQNKPPPILRLPHDENEVVAPQVMCTQHMCPIRVHWHVKSSYTEYWRVKITINNFNYVRNYSLWTLVAQHPNLQSIQEIFSFEYKALNQYGPVNDTGMFWGIKTYNDLLLASGPHGNVQTEMLLRKDKGKFTFRNGWAFPSKIIFNGDECVMPPADEYPRLPNKSSPGAIAKPLVPFMLCLLTFIKLLL
ncbi:hypothetical protein ACHQM5_022666 [Ranunculus cassubicifolius]